MGRVCGGNGDAECQDIGTEIRIKEIIMVNPPEGDSHWFEEKDEAGILRWGGKNLVCFGLILMVYRASFLSGHSTFGLCAWWRGAQWIKMWSPGPTMG